MTAEDRAKRALGLMGGGTGDPRDAENLLHVTAAIEEAVAAERERIAADLIKQGERTNMDFAEAMEWAAERIRGGK